MVDETNKPDLRPILLKWESIKERVNKDYSYGDADHLIIALFDEWLRGDDH